jgi:hypothetical protein
MTNRENDFPDGSLRDDSLLTWTRRRRKIDRCIAIKCGQTGRHTWTSGVIYIILLTLIQVTKKECNGSESPTFIVNSRNVLYDS